MYSVYVWRHRGSYPRADHARVNRDGAGIMHRCMFRRRLILVGELHLAVRPVVSTRSRRDEGQFPKV